MSEESKPAAECVTSKEQDKQQEAPTHDAAAVMGMEITLCKNMADEVPRSVLEDVVPAELPPLEFPLDKAACKRFCENLRERYGEMGLASGLHHKDEPILEVYCYDPDTDAGYCRISSAKHDGPLFASISSLYLHYNLTMDGYQNRFVDFGGETVEDILEGYVIATTSGLPPQQRASLEKKLEQPNPLLRGYDNAASAFLMHSVEKHQPGSAKKRTRQNE